MVVRQLLLYVYEILLSLKERTRELNEDSGVVVSDIMGKKDGYQTNFVISEKDRSWSFNKLRDG